MSSIKIKLTNKEWNKARNQLAEWYFTIPLSLFKRVISKNANVLLQLAECKGDLDTCLREDILGLFAEEFTGTDWPIGSTSKKKSNSFFKKFSKACKKRKIEFALEDYMRNSN